MHMCSKNVFLTNNLTMQKLMRQLQCEGWAFIQNRFANFSCTLNFIRNRGLKTNYFYSFLLCSFCYY